MSGETQQDKPVSLLRFCLRCCKSAADKSWGHYDHFTNLATIAQFVSVLGVVSVWIARWLKGVDVNFWLLAIPVGVSLVSFLVHLPIAAHGIYRDAINVGEQKEEALKAEVTDRDNRIEKLAKEIMSAAGVHKERLAEERAKLDNLKSEHDALLNEHQPLGLNVVVKELKYPVLAVLYICVRNPSTITPAQNIIIELLDIQCIPVGMGKPDHFPAEYMTARSAPIPTLNPGLAICPPLFQFKTFADGLVLNIENIIDGKSIVGATLCALEHEGKKIMPPTFNQFRFTVGVSASDRPRAIKNFRVAVSKADGDFKISVHDM